MAVFFFFNDTATTEIYTLSLHDALPILRVGAAPAGLREIHARLLPPGARAAPVQRVARGPRRRVCGAPAAALRSEEHTSELQSRQYLVCRLLLEKQNNIFRLTINANYKQ